MQLIDNTKTSVKILPVQERGKNAEGEAILLPPKRTIRLMPGVNQIEDADWEKVKALKGVQVFLEEGELLEIDATPLPKRPSKDAIKLVKNTFDKALLLKWREDEKREDVTKAIAHQINEITPSKEELERAKG